MKKNRISAQEMIQEEGRFVTIKDLKRRIGEVIGEPIVYKNYRGNVEKIRIGQQVVELVKKVQEFIPDTKLFDIGSYSPFVIDEETPSWQVDLWEPFLTEDGDVTLDNVKGMIWIILKSRQIGFSYVFFRLLVVLAFSLKEKRFVLGTKDKTWIEDIVLPYAREVLTYLMLERGEKADAFRGSGISGKLLGYEAKRLAFTFPTLTTIQLLGLDTMNDKNRGKGGLSVVGVDEAAYVTKASVLVNVLQPMVNILRGLFIYASTPNGDNWFKNVWDRAIHTLDKHYKYNTYNIYTCGIYLEERCDEIIMAAYNAHYDTDPTQSQEQIIKKIAQEYFCYFNAESLTKYFYPLFKNNPGLYCYSGRPLDFSDRSKFEVYLSIDYGGTNDAMAVLFIAVNSFGQAFVFDEVYQYGGGIQEAVDAVNAKIAYYNVVIVIAFIDKSTANTSVQINRQTAIKIATLFEEYGLEVTPVKTMPKKDRVDIVNEYMFIRKGLVNPLTAEKNSSMFFVSDNCVNLKKEMVNLKMSGTKTDKDGNLQEINFKKIKKDHASDALLYGLSELSGYKATTHKNRITQKVETSIAMSPLIGNNKLMERPDYSRSNSNVVERPRVSRFIR